MLACCSVLDFQPKGSPHVDPLNLTQTLRCLTATCSQISQPIICQRLCYTTVKKKIITMKQHPIFPSVIITVSYLRLYDVYLAATIRLYAVVLSLCVWSNKDSIGLVMLLRLGGSPVTGMSSMQKGAQREITSCMMMEKLYTSPRKVPFLFWLGFLSISGAVHRRSGRGEGN